MLGCRRSPEREETKAPERHVALAVRIAGCVSVSSDRTCEFAPERPLVAWIGGAEAVTVRVDGVPLESGSTELAEGGRRVRVPLPPDAHDVTFERRHVPGVLATHAVRVARALRAPELTAAAARKDEGKLDEALALLAPFGGTARPSADAPPDASMDAPREPPPGATAGDLARAASLLARIALAKGDVAAAVQRLTRGIEEHRALGQASDAVEDAFALTYVLAKRVRDYVAAGRALASIRELLRAYDEGAARYPYYEAIVAVETGDARAALRRLSLAETESAKLGLDKVSRNSRELLALTLADNGRAAAAFDVLERELRPQPELSTHASQPPGAAGTLRPLSPCERARVDENRGYVALRAAQQSDDATRQEFAKKALAALTVALEESGCNEAYRRSSILLNRANAARVAGRFEAARVDLEAARRAHPEPDPRVHLEWLLLGAELDWVDGHARRALASFERAEALASALLAHGLAWEAAFGRARALEAMRRTEAALVAYAHAEAIDAAAAREVPLGQGRGFALTEHDAGVRRHLDLLLDEHRTAEVVSVARASRSRFLWTIHEAARAAAATGAERDERARLAGEYATLRAWIEEEARDEWRKPSAELRSTRELRKRRERELGMLLDEALRAGGRAPPDPSPLPPDDLALVLHPTKTGWFGALSRGKTARIVRIARSVANQTPTDVARAIVRALKVELERASRLQVLAHGEFRNVDVHALTLEEGAPPLGVRVAVRYPLDLRARPASPGGPSGGGERIVVVADPTGDLPHARVEGREVAAIATERRGALVRTLFGADATRDAVLTALASNDLFHFAGHGVRGGEDGLDGHLPLANGAELRVGDVLTLGKMPSVVLLSACDAGAVDPDVAVEGLGMAQAFLVAGADTVIAPVRPVDDTLAASFARALHETRRGGGPSVRVDDAFVAAVKRLYEGSPGADWAAFRLFDP
jgi:hypothetical protein